MKSHRPPSSIKDKQKRIDALNRRYARLGSSKGWKLSRRLVPGHGNLNARVMLIGQAPGKNEDIQLKPFVGISGRLLDRLIASAGLDRKDLYITSTVQFFPPRNRVPTPKEIALCRPFLMEQISIIKPSIIVLLGSIASRSVLGLNKIMKAHGKAVCGGGIIYLPMLHPAAAVRLKKNLPLIEKDFKNLLALLEVTVL